MSLPEFLLARLDEDEREARKRIQSGEGKGTPRVNPSPARVLADVEAKRRIVAEHTPVDYGPLGMDSPNACHICGIDVGMSDWEYVRDSFPCVTLRLLALPYADHPDYRAEWKP